MNLQSDIYNNYTLLFVVSLQYSLIKITVAILYGVKVSFCTLFMLPSIFIKSVDILINVL